MKQANKLRIHSKRATKVLEKVIHPQCFGTLYGVWTFKHPKQQMRHQPSSHIRRGWHAILSVP